MTKLGPFWHFCYNLFQVFGFHQSIIIDAEFDAVWNQWHKPVCSGVSIVFGELKFYQFLWSKCIPEELLLDWIFGCFYNYRLTQLQTVLLSSPCSCIWWVWRCKFLCFAIVAVLWLIWVTVYLFAFSIRIGLSNQSDLNRRCWYSQSDPSNQSYRKPDSSRSDCLFLFRWVFLANA